MAKNVELLSVTAPHDVLHPRTVSDMVNVSDTKNLTQKLSELDAEFKKYLPLTGGTLTGLLNANGGISTTTGNLNINASGTVNIAKDTNVTGNLGSTGHIEAQGRVISNEAIYAKNGAVGRFVAKVAGHGGVDLGDSSALTAICSNDTPKYYDGNFRYDIHNDKDHPIQSGDWSPQFTAQNGGTVTYVSRDGKYSRYGNMVIVTFNIIARNPVNFNGQLHVTNLPFVNQTGTHVGCTLFAIRGFNVGVEANNRQICTYIRPGESRITFNYSDTTATTSNIVVLTHSQLITTNQIEISATVVYKIS